MYRFVSCKKDPCVPPLPFAQDTVKAKKKAPRMCLTQSGGFYVFLKIKVSSVIFAPPPVLRGVADIPQVSMSS